MNVIESKFKLFTYVFLSFVAFNLASCAGDDEMVLDRVAFLGEYRSFTDSCVLETYQINLTTSGQSSQKIIITNLHGLSNLSVTATVNSNSFSIDPVQLNGQLISGQGVLNGNNLTITYVVDDSTNGSFSCDASFDRL